MKLIIPTIISRNQIEFDEYFNKIKKYVKWIQIDIMDGKFVKNKSNWFDLKLNKKWKYEAHLMIDEPDKYIYKNYRKFDILIANYERVKDPVKLINFCKSKKKKLRFAINPETPVIHIIPFLDKLDGVLVLTVNPGRYGATFISKTLKKIKNLRKITKKNIEVDGAMNPVNIKKCFKAGANLFCVGSYIKNSKDIKKSIFELKQSLNN